MVARKKVQVRLLPGGITQLENIRKRAELAAKKKIDQSAVHRTVLGVALADPKLVDKVVARLVQEQSEI